MASKGTGVATTFAWTCHQLLGLVQEPSQVFTELGPRKGGAHGAVASHNFNPAPLNAHLHCSHSCPDGPSGITFAFNNVPMTSVSIESTEGTFSVLFAVGFCFRRAYAHTGPRLPRRLRAMPSRRDQVTGSRTTCLNLPTPLAPFTETARDSTSMTPKCNNLFFQPTNNLCLSKLFKQSAYMFPGAIFHKELAKDSRQPNAPLQLQMVKVQKFIILLPRTALSSDSQCMKENYLSFFPPTCAKH